VSGREELLLEIASVDGHEEKSVIRALDLPGCQGQSSILLLK
jgi:hypothetical protein